MASVSEEAQKLSFNQQQADQLREQTKQYEIQTKNLKDFAVSHDKILSIQAKQLQNLVEIGNLTGGLTDKTKAWADSQAQLAERYSQTFALQENWFTKSASFIRDIAEAEKNRKEVEKEITAALAKQGAKYEEVLEHLEDEEKVQEKRKKLMEKQAKLMKEQAKLIEKHGKAAARRLPIFKENQKALNSTFSYLKKTTPELMEQVKLYNKISDQTREIKKQTFLAASFKGIEQLGAGVGKYADAFGKVQGIGAEMYKATGGMTSLIDNVQETFSAQGALDLADYGIGFEGISEAMTNLHRRSGEFATASSEVQAEVGLTTAKLARLGVTAETSAELFNTLRLNFGFSADQFGEMADTFVGRASDIGMSVEQYTSDFQASYPVLSRYGTDAVNVFDKLARQARASGLSVQELAQSMGQFDTFQGAAENASKLNFLLGSQLDTTQLLMADEAERLDMIKGAFSPAQFQNMDKFKKKAIAAAAGFSDVSAFEKAMRGDADKLGDLAKTQQEKLDDATRKSTSEVEAFGQAATNMADQLALSVMPKLSESLGDGATGLYGMSKAASIGLSNFSGMVQIGSAALAMFNARLATSGGGMDLPGRRGKRGGFSGKGPAGGFSKAAKMAKAAKFVRGAGTAGALISGAAGAYDLYSRSKSGQEIGGKEVGEVAGQMGGAMAGAKVGAMIGAFGGPVGIVAGGLIGGALGAIGGEKLGGMVGSLADEGKKAKKEKDKTNKNIERLLEDGNKERAKLVEAEERKKQRDQTQKNWSHVIGTRTIDSRRNITGS